MSEPRSEDDGELREWAPMSGFLKDVPLQVRKGLFLENVSLTCVDCVQEYLAVGTNIGVVYWYNRETNSMERLRPEKSNVCITCVKVVSSVDYMVAAGDKTGVVTVFKVPKPTPDFLPEVYKQNVTRQVERYTVSGLHSVEITHLEWSVNGQKLFSGDTVGVVVYTEIDFYMNLSKACEILNEKYRVVQLSFSHHKRTLLVATEFRCILAYKDDDWRVVQVGQKERNSLCALGATFFLLPSRPVEPIVYACRPGFRIWQAGSDGTVHKTIIFKEALKKQHPVIRLLRQFPALSPPIQNQDFGVVYIWRDSLLVTYNKNLLLVIDPQKATVLASLTTLTELRSVAVIHNEIFCISGTRNIIRLSYTPDKYGGENKSGSLFSMGELHVAPVADTLLDISNRLKEGAHKIKPFLNSTAIRTTVNGQKTEYEEDVATADEAVELPPVKLLSSEDILELTVNFSKSPVNERSRLFEKIGEQEFDDILSTSSKKYNLNKHKTKRKKSIQKNSPTTSGFIKDTEANSDSMSVSTASIRSVLSDQSNEDETSTLTYQNNNSSLVNPVGVLSGDENNSNSVWPTEGRHVQLQLLCDIPIPDDIQPDLRSPDTILREVLEKERLLAEALNMKDELLSSEDETNKVEEKCDWMDETKQFGEEQSSMSFGPPSGSSSAQPSLEPVSLQSGLASTATLIQSPTLSPLTPSSASSDYQQPSAGVVTSNGGQREPNLYGWITCSCPEVAQWLAVSSQFVCMGGANQSLYCSPIVSPVSSLRWRDLKYEASRLVLSPTSKLIWKLHFNGAYALADTTTAGPCGDSWKLVARDVESVSLSDSEAWYTSQGKVLFQRGLSREMPVGDSLPIEVPDFALKVCCFRKNVWLLLRDNKLMRRKRVEIEGSCEGSDWVIVKTPDGICLADIALGPKNIGWIVDSDNTIYFSDNYDDEVTVWWQIVVDDCSQENYSLSKYFDKLHGRRAKPLSIVASESAIWITNKVESAIQLNNTHIVGHIWDPVPLPHLKYYKWRQICAEGVFEDNGQLWLLSKSGDLFCTKPSVNKLESIVLPCRPGDVVCLAAARDVLWLLTEEGDIFIRQCCSDVDVIAEGPKWKYLSLEQIKRRFHLRHISCGCDVVWACDKSGDMHMVVGSPHSIPTDTFPPAWVQVEGKPHPDIVFTKVFVGPHTFMVWALDNKNNIYVREAIFPDYQIGVGWVQVMGIQAVHLSISGVAVWAVSPTGTVHRRCGISENNYIGDYWLRIPGSLSTLSVSVSEDVWGVSMSLNELFVHSQKVLTFTETDSEYYECATNDGWEIVN